MKRILSMFAVAVVWLYTPAAGQMPASEGLTAPTAHIPDAPDTFSEAKLPGGDLTWKPLTPLSSPRYALAAVTAPDGSIFVIGGADASSVSTVVEVYRPGSNQWRASPSLPRPRYRLAAATGGDGRIYAIGGSDPGGEGLPSSVLALTPGADRWVAVALLTVGRQLLGATAGADGRIYVVGGHNLGALNLLEIYDPTRDQWTPGAPMPTPRYDMGVALGGDGRIYAIGGSGDGVLNVLDVVEAYSPATDSWTTVAPLPSRRALVDASTGPGIWRCQACTMPAHLCCRAARNRPLNRRDAYACYRASLGVEQPVPRISVSFFPLPQVSRHSALCWSSCFSSTPTSWLPVDLLLLLSVRKSSSYLIFSYVILL